MLYTFILLPSIFLCVFSSSSSFFFILFLFLFFIFPFTRPHEAEEWQLLPTSAYFGQNWLYWPVSMAVSAGIGMFWWPFRPYWFPFLPESARFGPNKKKKGRVGASDAEHASQIHKIRQRLKINFNFDYSSNIYIYIYIYIWLNIYQ